MKKFLVFYAFLVALFIVCLGIIAFDAYSIISTRTYLVPEHEIIFYVVPILALLKTVILGDEIVSIQFDNSSARFNFAIGWIDVPIFQIFTLVLLCILVLFPIVFFIIRKIVVSAKEKASASRAAKEEALYQRFKERMEREKRR